MTRLAMFPLGVVVFPHTTIPLQVFEPRYQTLLDNVLADDGLFGTVLIERGFEVGGGDARFQIGTLVKVVGVSALPEGRRLIAVNGLGRIRVTDWLTDDPHPWAIVEHLDDAPDEGNLRSVVEEGTRCLRRVLGLASAAGVDVGTTELTMPDDAVKASYQLAALSPLGPLDAYRLLEADPVEERLRLGIAFLEDLAVVLQSRLAGE